MKNIFHSITFGVILVALFACHPKINKKNNNLPLGENHALTPPDFSNYVALGNSLTAGMADGSLYDAAQKVAYPNLVAQQLQKAGLNKKFTTPFIGGENGVYLEDAKKLIYTPTLRGKLIYKGMQNGAPIIKFTPADVSAFVSAELLQEEKYPYNNLGVPGIAVADLQDKLYIQGNIFSRRMQPTEHNPLYGKNNTYLDMVADAVPTFFSIWLGANDVLGYAVRGGGEHKPGALDNLTTPQLFATNYNALLQTIYNKNPEAKGVVMSVPNLFCVSYFTAIKYDVLTLSREQAEGLQKLLGAMAALGLINNNMQDVPTLQAGKNPLLIFNPKNRLLRSAGKQEIMLFSLSTKLTVLLEKLAAIQGTPTFVELTDLLAAFPNENDVLDTLEIAAIQQHTQIFNRHIRTAIAQYGNNIAFIDVDDHLCKAASPSGVTIDGVTLKSDFLTGGVFSLDALHLTPRGNAYTANMVIQAINQHFNQRIERLNIARFSDVREQQ